MHGPLGRRRRTGEQIVKAIINQLRPLKGKHDDAAAAVQREIDSLRILDPLLKNQPPQRAMREHAKRVRKALDRFEHLMQTAPGRFGRALHGAGFWGSFPRQMKHMREMCDRAIRGEFGDHPNRDGTKTLCASRAAALMKEQSERRSTSSSPNSPFRMIAGLLYEAVTGQKAD